MHENSLCLATAFVDGEMSVDYWAQPSTNNIEMVYGNNLPSYMSTTSRYAPSEEALVVRITRISATDINNEKENI
jgi:hypothetical protein